MKLGNFVAARTALAVLFLVGGAGVSVAQQSPGLGGAIVNGIFGLIGHASAVSHAKKAWLLIDAQTQGCVAEKTGTQPDDMMDNGIGPDDARVAPYINACRREAEQARAHEAQAAAALAAQKEGDRQARKQARLAAAAAKAAKDARHHELTAKYGAEAATAIESGQVRVGMTKDQVVAVRGAPTQKDSVPPDYELWHYAAGDVAFTNGRVSYVGR